MNVFIDTSAFLAVLDADDAHHAEAKAIWGNILSQDAVLVCHNYILVETSALVQRRLGIEALRLFERDIVPLLRVEWIKSEIHDAAASALLLAARRALSLVDCVSFEIMKRTGVRLAFAFDTHFREYGFDSI